MMVSHDVQECFAICRLRLPDVAAAASSSRTASPRSSTESDDPQVRQFIRGEPDGPVRFHYPAPPLAEALRGCRNDRASSNSRCGQATLARTLDCALGPRTRTSSSTCCAPARRRCAGFGLVVDQIHAIGNRSLTIILASGFAVGFVLALQMYYALVPYGAAESLGPGRQPVAGARARARSSPRCCSPAAPAPRSPPRSA